MRTCTSAFVFAAAAAFAAPAAPAKDMVQDLLAKAKEKARAAEVMEAAGLYGDALALAQKQADLLVEQEVFDAFTEFLQKVPRPPREGGREVASTTGTPRDVLAAVLSRLDAKRCGAFVSAPCLAGDLLLEAIGKGDGKFVKEAAAALAPHAKGKSGLGLATLAKFGATLQETPSGAAPPAGGGPLELIFATASQEGWIDVAMAAGVELAARDLARPDGAAAAKASVERLAALVTAKTEARLVVWIREAADARLKGASEEVLKPLADAIAGIGGQSVSAAGGAGGAGGKGGEAGKPISPLGEVLRKGGRGGPIGTATRTKEGFEFRVAWDPKFKGVHQHQDGVKHLDDGGLTVAFLDWSVAARMADPVGTRGQPGESSHPEPGRAFYRIARGETWTLRADGVVAVGR